VNFWQLKIHKTCHYMYVRSILCFFVPFYVLGRSQQIKLNVILEPREELLKVK